MSSFRFEQHGSVGKLILLGDADSAPGTDFPSSLRAAVHEAQASDTARSASGFELSFVARAIRAAGSASLLAKPRREPRLPSSSHPPLWRRGPAPSAGGKREV